MFLYNSGPCHVHTGFLQNMSCKHEVMWAGVDGGKSNSGDWRQVMLQFTAPLCVCLSSLVSQRAHEETIDCVKEDFDTMLTVWLEAYKSNDAY